MNENANFVYLNIFSFNNIFDNSLIVPNPVTSCNPGNFQLVKIIGKTFYN